jgi:lipopolysaccharide transport system permease protein
MASEKQQGIARNVAPLGAPASHHPGKDGRDSGSALRAVDSFEIGPARRWFSFDARDVWRHRELLYFLTWRDIKIRYKQTALGASWAVLQPLLTTVVFSLFFGRLANIPSQGVPYPVFSFAALVPWTFFSNSVTLGANSLIVTPDLITKIYFPRIFLPASSILAGLVDFAIAFVVLIGMIAYYGITPGFKALLVFPLLLLTIITTLGVTLWFSALNVEYRDIRYTTPFLLQLWLFATPIAYPSTLVHGPARILLGLNPLAGVVEGFRWALLGTRPAPGPMVAVSAGVALLLALSGLFYFQRVEGRFADVI